MVIQSQKYYMIQHKAASDRFPIKQSDLLYSDIYAMIRSLYSCSILASLTTCINHYYHGYTLSEILLIASCNRWGNTVFFLTRAQGVLARSDLISYTIIKDFMSNMVRFDVFGTPKLGTRPY